MTDSRSTLPPFSSWQDVLRFASREANLHDTRVDIVLMSLLVFVLSSPTANSGDLPDVLLR